MDQLTLYLLLFLVAVLYGSVGHAGASGYLAVLTLIGWAPVEARSFALVLNLFASAVVSIRFISAGYFRPVLFSPIALAGFPAAFAGALFIQSPKIITAVIGLVLLFAAFWLLTGKREPEQIQPSSTVKKLLLGGSIGVLAGVSGTGGGIFLSPALLYLRWGKLKEIAATSAPFIFFNSLGGLLGLTTAGRTIDPGWVIAAVFVAIGGALGSHLGVRTVNIRWLQMILASVLFIAGAKLLLF